MEFRLNKVDPEVRQRVKETTSAGKVHTKSGIVINEHNKKNKENEEPDFSEKLRKQKDKKKKKILIEAVKVEEVEVPSYKEPEDSAPDENRGHFLDVRK